MFPLTWSFETYKQKTASASASKKRQVFPIFPNLVKKHDAAANTLGNLINACSFTRAGTLSVEVLETDDSIGYDCTIDKAKKVEVLLVL